MGTRPRLRRFMLVVHVVASVGWLGAVAATLALSVVALTDQDGEVVRSIYITLEQTGWTVLIPFALASLLTGLVQSLGTKWGLFRHYWVLAKLGISLFATGILLLYVQTLTFLADLAAQTGGGDVGALRSPSPVIHSIGAVVFLLVAAGLSVYKPQGVTPYGWRKQREARAVLTS